MLFLTCPLHSLGPAHSDVLKCKVEDIHEFYDGVRANGLQPATEPTKKEGMLEFELRDPDGYNLVFFWKK